MIKNQQVLFTKKLIIECNETKAFSIFFILNINSHSNCKLI